MQLPTSLLILVLLSFRVSAASNTDDEITPEPEPSDSNRRNYNGMDELMAQLNGESRRFYLELGGPVDSDVATMFLVDYLVNHRNEQCTACVDALRIYSTEGGEILEELLDLTYPKVIRRIAGMKPVVDPILSRYTHLDGEPIPIHHAVRECSVIYRSYVEAFFTFQMNSVEPGSEDDVFYAFDGRLTPEIRMQALEAQLGEFESVSDGFSDVCTVDDAVFTPDITPDGDVEDLKKKFIKLK